MTPQEMAMVQRSRKRWREARRIAGAAVRNNKREQARVEAELELIAGELAEMGIDWRSEQGMYLAAELLKSRLGPDEKEEESRYDADYFPK